VEGAEGGEEVVGKEEKGGGGGRGKGGGGGKGRTRKTRGTWGPGGIRGAGGNQENLVDQKGPGD
jgi:hypothetical protein